METIERIVASIRVWLSRTFGFREEIITSIISIGIMIALIIILISWKIIFCIGILVLIDFLMKKNISTSLKWFLKKISFVTSCFIGFFIINWYVNMHVDAELITANKIGSTETGQFTIKTGFTTYKIPVEFAKIQFSGTYDNTDIWGQDGDNEAYPISVAKTGWKNGKKYGYMQNGTYNVWTVNQPSMDVKVIYVNSHYFEKVYLVWWQLFGDTPRPVSV